VSVTTTNTRTLSTSRHRLSERTSKAEPSNFVFSSKRAHFLFSQAALKLFVAAGDLLCFIGASLVAAEVYRELAGGTTFREALATSVISAVMFVMLGGRQGCYRLSTILEPVAHLRELIVAALMSLVIPTCVFFLLKVGDQHSRAVMIMFAGIACLFLPGARLLVGAASRRATARGLFAGRPTVMIGTAQELDALTPHELVNFGINEVGRFALSPEPGAAEVLNDANRNQVAHAIKLARELSATEFALVLPWSQQARVRAISAALRHSPLPARLYPDMQMRSVLSRYRHVELDPHFSVTIQREPLRDWEQALKRCLDVLLAGIALVLLAPMLLFTALAIKLDSPGPVLFRQRRAGFDGRIFVILKFRTMSVLEDNGPIVQASRKDARVTRIGRVLRRTSIDELPQLLNVLRGEMSLVGPRPHAIVHDDEYRLSIVNYALRHHVKPGLTGAAQIAGLRGETRQIEQMARRVERDLWYINNWSLMLDLKIIAATAWALVKHEAY